ncbi:HRDC domain-containing protein [candidate division KSB1 bacterium]|nr:HRDC domain-containing protein [candidate division KSB1 bacterium]
MQSAPKALPAAATDALWNEVDRALFEKLRRIRRDLAEQRHVPAYVILHDAALRELARSRPKSLTELARVSGIGDRKIQEFGQVLVQVIRAHLGQRG